MKKTYIALLLSLFAMSTYGGTEIDNNTTTIDRTNTNSSNGSYELVKTNSDGSFEMVLPSSRSSSEMLSPPHSLHRTPPVEFDVSNSQKTESNSSSSPVQSPRHSPIYDQRYRSFIELLHNSNLTDEEKFILRTNPDAIEYFEAISNERRSTASSNNSLQFPLNEQLTSRNNLPDVIPRTWRDENDFTPRRQLLPPPAPDQQPRLRTGSNGAPTISPINSRRNSNVSNTDEQLTNPYVSPQELREIVNSLQEANPTINFDINEINRHLNNPSPINNIAPEQPITLTPEPIIIRTDNIVDTSINLVANDITITTPSIASSELIITPEPIVLRSNPIVINTDTIVANTSNIVAHPIISDIPLIVPTNLIIDAIEQPIPIAPENNIQAEQIIEHEVLPNIVNDVEITNLPQIRDDTLLLPPQTNIIVQQPQVAVQNPIIPEVIVQEQVLPTITRTDDNFYRTKQHFPELISELFSTSMFDLDGYYTLGIFSNYRYKNFKANTYGSSISVGEKHDKYAYSVKVGLIRSDLKYYELKKTVNTSLISVRLQYFIDETNSLNVVPSFAFSKFGKRYINNYNIKTYLESKLALIPFKLDMILGADSQFCKYNKGNNNTDAMTKLRLSKVYAKGNLKFTPSFTIGLYAPKNIIYLNQRLKFNINDSFGAIDLELFSKKKNYHFVVSGKISIFF